ncbi:hypothetical protein ABNQ39_20825 [Azospirillum sp. A26]|uniref:hypothetical protein n=1 Tax=Azospirillum sp. A26 TaxID=3160607 RepID=UPI003671290E
MLMTEEQARTKWCPLARVDSGFAGCGVVNRYPARDARGSDCSGRREMMNETVVCVSSDCMAWRWGECEPSPAFEIFKDNPCTESLEEIHRPEGIPEAWEWCPARTDENSVTHSAGYREPLSEAKARRRGYCGAFGKAEG